MKHGRERELLRCRSRQETSHAVAQLREDLQSGSLAAGDLTSKALEDRLYTAVSTPATSVAMHQRT